MTNKIKFAIDKMKGCGEEVIWCNLPFKCGEMEDLKHSDHIIYCNKCRKKLKEIRNKK